MDNILVTVIVQTTLTPVGVMKRGSKIDSASYLIRFLTRRQANSNSLDFTGYIHVRVELINNRKVDHKVKQKKMASVQL